jgi:hypothetical protein
LPFFQGVLICSLVALRPGREIAKDRQTKSTVTLSKAFVATITIVVLFTDNRNQMITIADGKSGFLKIQSPWLFETQCIGRKAT